MPDRDLGEFIRDITRRHERVFQEQLKQWQALHERSDRLAERDRVLAERMEAFGERMQEFGERMQEFAEEARAQRDGLFKLIDAIRDLENGLGGASA